MAMRIGVITPTPTPYRDLLWNAVASQSGIDLHVYYCASGTADRPWAVSWPRRFSWEILPGKSVMPNGASYCNPTMWRRLNAGKHDYLILGGYNHVTMLCAVAYARMHRVPYALMCETHLGSPKHAWRSAVKGPVVKYILRHASACFPTGVLARKYLEHYGAAPDRMYAVPNSPDLNALVDLAARLSPSRAETRRSFGLDDSPVVLFVGRLIDLKRPEVLLKACRMVFAEEPGQVVIVGDGPKRGDLERVAEELGIRKRTRFVGWKEPSQLIEWYSVSDLFVLPSCSETWGVVVLEALACGLPVVISDRVGSHPDVINCREVGTVVPVDDVAELASAILSRFRNRVSPEDVIRAWTPVRERLSYPVVARGMVEVLLRTVGGRLGDWAVK